MNDNYIHVQLVFKGDFDEPTIDVGDYLVEEKNLPEIEKGLPVGYYVNRVKKPEIVSSVEEVLEATKGDPRESKRLLDDEE